MTGMSKQAKTEAPADMSDQQKSKEANLAKLREQKVDPYPHTFVRADKAADIQEKYKDLPNGGETEDIVVVAGRIYSMRNSGMFIDLRDTGGKIQIFCHKDRTPEAEMAKLDNYDIGDIIGVKGKIRRTPRGELSVAALELTMLAKSILPLPEKYHGLTDVEARYRQRYLDLIMNDEARTTLRTRSKVVSAIREYMEDSGAIEVETPMLHAIMGGATAKPFITHHNTLDTDFYMRVAPELYLKRLIVGGLADDVFEIGRCFRNEGISPRHNPEFTSIEGYHAYKDYNDMMTLVESMVQFVVKKVHGKLKIPYGDYEIDFTGPWPRKTMVDLVKEKTGIDFLACKDAKAAHAECEKAKISVDPKLSWGEVVAAVFEEKVEESLIQPIHVTDFPMEISPLAKTHRSNPRLVERFESFINTWEIANAFSELNDPKVQYDRFMDQVKAREAGNDEAQMLDQDYVTALEYGMPPCGGWGLGIDRLCMLLTNSLNIRDVICFPTLKPKN
jgi:lysyl-tRNA synthetase class 2